MAAVTAEATCRATDPACPICDGPLYRTAMDRVLGRWTLRGQPVSSGTPKAFALTLVDVS